MATEEVTVSVNSRELEALIAQLRESQAQLAAMEQAADEAARAMDNLGDEADQAGNSMDKAGDGADTFSISGAKAAVAGAAMGAAMVVVEKAMEAAGAAIGAINEATINYIKTTKDGRAIVDGLTSAIEENKIEIAKAVAGTGLYQESMVGLTSIIPSVTKYITDMIGVVDDLKTIWENTGAVINQYNPIMIGVGAIWEANKFVMDTATSTISDLAEISNLLFGEVREGTTEVQTITSAWDTYTAALDRVIDSTIRVGMQFRATAAVSNLAGSLVRFVTDNTYAQEQAQRAQAEAAREQAAATAAAVAASQAELQVIRSLIDARNSLEDSNDQRLNSILEDDLLERRIERLRIFRDATEGQQRFLLGIWEEEDRRQEERLRRDEIFAQRRASRESEIRNRSFTEAQLALEESLNNLLEPAQRRTELLFGGGDFEQLAEQNGKLATFILNMSDEAASALGALNMAMKDLASGFAGSFSSALASGENVGKALKEALGGMLNSLGQSYAVMGAGLLIPPPFNPLGNPAAGGVMIGVGAGMMGLASAFGYRGSSDTGASPSVAASSPSGSNQTTYSNVSFGFVGDRRLAAREVASVQRDAQRRGL